MKKGLIALTLLLATLNAFAQTTIYSNNFESGNGGWTDGGDDSDYLSNDSNAPQGSGSWRIKDDSGNASAFWQDFDFSAYDEVTISFSFKSVDFDDDDDRFEVLIDDNKIEEFEFENGGWNNNETRYTSTLTLTNSSYNFNTTNEIKFETTKDTSNDDYLYIDEIVITGSNYIFYENFSDDTASGNANDFSGNDEINNIPWTADVQGSAKRWDISGDKWRGENVYTPSSFTTDPFSISGYENLQFQFYIDYDSNLDDTQNEWIKVFYTIDDGTEQTLAEYYGEDTDQTYTVDLPSDAVGDDIVLRIEMHHDSNKDEHKIDNIKLLGIPIITTTWNGSAWSNGTPDINADAVISGDYSVASTNPSFSCKSLTVDAGVTCRVRWNRYIEIETDITVAGTLLVTTKGSIVQNSANGAVTVTGAGKIQNEKITAPSNNYYEYTYWSSPMTSTTYNNTLPDVSTQSRYTFNAANYADENGDSFDDNGDAWVAVGGNTVWTPGRGYTGYPDPEVFNADEDGRLKFTFEGVFNNGTIDVPVYRNDEYNFDGNSNLLGNPYPSAIDVLAFFTENEFNGIETPFNSYEPASGQEEYLTGVTNVNFNTINNSDNDTGSNKNTGYEDFTDQETILTQGEEYDLTVKINTDGNYTNHTWVWIDWNLDGDFSDVGEAYDLGEDTNLNNEETASSPFSIMVPNDAIPGKRTMRVASKYNYNPSFDENGFDGEVEDYSIIIGGGKSLDAIVYLWSQNTAPNAGQFSASDYAYINKSGGTAGGDQVEPAQYIPSGQGFFVNFSDSAVPTNGQGTVRFTNSMRSTGNNSQFFRNTTNNDADNDEVFVNRLRLNLTSDNGVFNQILVAYMNEATDLDDGLAYDAPRRLETGAAAYLYSLQNDDATKQYAIQAKNDTSLDLSEVIKIGYTTSIEQATIYSLKLADIVEISDEDSFFYNVPIYIKDNLTGAMHDLKIGPYNFTSESGTYNERFEIVFQADTLGIEDVEANENALKIIESRNGDVRFLFNGSQTMSSIEIFDVQGRAIYNFRPNKTDVTYKLSNLRQAPFIARIVLDNDVVITKKAIKRY